jgi:hypothetical protein
MDLASCFGEDGVGNRTGIKGISILTQPVKNPKRPPYSSEDLILTLNYSSF